MICKNCGTKNDGKNNYCTEDGYPLIESESTSTYESSRTKYCNNCGNEGREEDLYCASCGNDFFRKLDLTTEKSGKPIVEPLKKEEEIPLVIKEDDGDVEEPKPKGGFKRIGIILGIILLVVGLGFGGYRFATGGSIEDRVLGKMDEAIRELDVVYLKDKMEMVDGEKLNETNIKDIVSVMKEEKFSISKMDSKSEDLGVSREGMSIKPISLIQEGKEGIIYDDYKLVFEYYDLILNTNTTHEEFELLVDGEEISEPLYDGEELVIEKIKPGNHKLEIKYGPDLNEAYTEEFQAIELDRVNEVTISSEELRSKLTDHDKRIPLNIDAFVEATMVEVYSYLSEEYGKVYLVQDGEKTDKVLNDWENISVGPIFEGKEMVIKAVVEIDGESYESEEVILNSDSEGSYELFIDYEPPYRLDEAEMEGLMVEYLNSLVDSINTGYFGYVSHYMDEAGPLYKQQEKLVENLYSQDIEEILLDYSFKNFKADGDNKYKVTVTEKHKIIYPDKDDKEVENTWVYTIVIRDEEALIHSLAKA